MIFELPILILVGPYGAIANITGVAKDPFSSFCGKMADGHHDAIALGRAGIKKLVTENDLNLIAGVGKSFMLSLKRPCLASQTIFISILQVGPNGYSVQNNTIERK